MHTYIKVIYQMIGYPESNTSFRQILRKNEWPTQIEVRREVIIYARIFI